MKIRRISEGKWKGRETGGSPTDGIAMNSFLKEEGDNVADAKVKGRQRIFDFRLKIDE